MKRQWPTSLRWGLDLYWVYVMWPSLGWWRDHREFGEPLRVYLGPQHSRWLTIVPISRWVRGAS